MKKRNKALLAVILGLGVVATVFASTTGNSQPSSQENTNWQLPSTGMPDKAYRPNP